MLEDSCQHYLVDRLHSVIRLKVFLSVGFESVESRLFEESHARAFFFFFGDVKALIFVERPLFDFMPCSNSLSNIPCFNVFLTVEGEKCE